jgi:hypothetical protein
MRQDSVLTREWLKIWLAHLSCLCIGLLFLWSGQDPLQVLVGVFFLGVFTIIMLSSMLGTHLRDQWTDVAQKYSLERRSRSAWSLGRVEGRIEDRALIFDRARPFGDGSLFRVSARLRLELKPSLRALRVHPEKGITDLDVVLFREIQMEPPELCEEFLFRGLDPIRLRELLSAPDVGPAMLAITRLDLDLSIRDGWLELRWPGLELAPFDDYLSRLQQLADHIERSDGAGWAEAALEMDLDWIQGADSWSLGDPTDPGKQSISYRMGNPGEFSVHYPLAGIRDWTLRARIPGEVGGSQTRDPILDSQVFVEGIPESVIRCWTTDSTSHGHILEAVCGRGFVLSRGVLSTTQEGFLARPVELVEALNRLAILLKP